MPRVNLALTGDLDRGQERGVRRSVTARWADAGLWAYTKRQVITMGQREAPPGWEDEPSKEEIRQMNGVWAMEDARNERAGRGPRSKKPSTRAPSKEVSDARLKHKMEEAAAEAIQRKREKVSEAEREAERVSKKAAGRTSKDSNFFIKAGKKQ